MLGGGALWILGDLVGLPFLAAVLIAMIREDESDAKVIDAELDQAELDQAELDQAELDQAELDNAAQPRPAGPDRQPDAGQPWWVNDPRFAERFAPVDPDQ